MALSTLRACTGWQPTRTAPLTLPSRSLHCEAWPTSASCGLETGGATSPARRPCGKSITSFTAAFHIANPTGETPFGMSIGIACATLGDATGTACATLTPKAGTDSGAFPSQSSSPPSAGPVTSVAGSASEATSLSKARCSASADKRSNGDGSSTVAIIPAAWSRIDPETRRGRAMGEMGSGNHQVFVPGLSSYEIYALCFRSAACVEYNGSKNGSRLPAAVQKPTGIVS